MRDVDTDQGRKPDRPTAQPQHSDPWVMALSMMVSAGHQSIDTDGALPLAMANGRDQSKSRTQVTRNVRITPSCSVIDTYSPGTKLCRSNLNPGSSSSLL